MSLRYASRLVYQAGMRAVQGMKEQVVKYSDSTIKTFRDSSSAASSKQARLFSGSVADSEAFKVTNKNTDKLKQAEESFRTVMYLSCWGPN